MPAKKLELSKINVEGGTQIRAAVNENTVTEYAELMKAGVEMPPVEVFFDGMVYWLADGFHRVTAAFEAGLDTILANVRTGKKRDAILFACGANASHGLKRTNADKRMAVETLLNDSEWVKWSDNRIAEAVAVSVNFVGDVRRQLSSDDNSPAAKAAAEPRVGKDGKSYPKKEKAEREPKATPKHVVDTPPEEKRKITGGTAFNPEEYADATEDQAGNAIPADLMPVFAQADAFADVLNNLSKARAGIERLLNTPAGNLIKNSLGNVDLKNIYAQVKFAQPFAICPRKKHDNCDVCKGRKWINKEVHDSVAKHEGAA